MERFTTTLLLFLQVKTSTGQTRCGGKDYEFYGRCIFVPDYLNTFENSKLQCYMPGGYLMESPNITEELPALATLLLRENLSEAWIGARNQKLWYWSANKNSGGGSIVERKFWVIGSPDELRNSRKDRISLQSHIGFKWTDEAGGNHRSGPELLPNKALCFCYQQNNKTCGQNLGEVHNLTVQDGWSFFIPKEENLSWSDAAAVCSRYGAYVARVETEKLQNIMQKDLPKGANYWIAGYWNFTYSLAWLNGNLIPNKSDIWDSIFTESTKHDSCVFLRKGPSLTSSLSTSDCNGSTKASICQRSHRDIRRPMGYKSTVKSTSAQKETSAQQSETSLSSDVYLTSTNIIFKTKSYFSKFESTQFVVTQRSLFSEIFTASTTDSKWYTGLVDFAITIPGKIVLSLSAIALLVLVISLIIYRKLEKHTKVKPINIHQ